ncbi:hypothetical protein X749_30640 [Mesorhizobium sp. LNJC391B00]|nr:hypothetical protein X749_30640 [Mesorhizobium sp. LNJC391B00]
MQRSFSVGTLVRLVATPPNLVDADELRTATLFSLCLGKTFPIREITDGMAALDVGEILGEPSYMHTIYVEPEFLEFVTG